MLQMSMTKVFTKIVSICNSCWKAPGFGCLCEFWKCHCKSLKSLFTTVNSDDIDPLRRKAISRELNFRKYTEYLYKNESQKLHALT